MINNRYLYRFFLEGQPLPYAEYCRLFNGDYFMRWKAVKNGLYKASVCGGKKSLLGDVCGHLGRLMDEEIAMAEKILDKGLTAIK